jgi:flagellin
MHMNITGLAGLTGSQQSQNLQKTNAKLQAAIASLVSGTKSNKEDVASLSIASQMQAGVANLKQVSGNIAQASSLAQIADSGAEQLQGAIEELQKIAQQANSPTISDDNRKQLNEQFQQISKSLDKIVGGTSFNGQKLLDGSVSGDNSITLGKILTGDGDGDNGGLAINNLSKDALFGGKNLNVLTTASAGEAVSTLADALKQVTGVRVDIGTFEQTLNFVGANIDSAVINQEAARAILQDSDFAEEAGVLSLLNIQRNASLALQAQGNKLLPNLLNKLIG